MKKTLISIFLSLICVFTFCACKDDLSEKYWQDVSNEVKNVLTDEDFNNVYNITFNGNLTEIMSHTNEYNEADNYGSTYAELKLVFAPIFKSSISYAYVHYGDLLVNPVNTNSAFKNKVKTIKKKLNNFKKEIKTFSDNNRLYQSKITFTDKASATSAIEQSRLLTFKRSYISLINSALSLSKSIFEARKVGYYNFSDYTDNNLNIPDLSADCQLAIEASNLSILDVTFVVISAFNAKFPATVYNGYYQKAAELYNFIEENVYNQEVVAGGAEDEQSDEQPSEEYLQTKNNLAKWKQTFSIFETESNNLKRIAKKIDLDVLKKANYNPETYAQKTGNSQDKDNAEYFLNFHEKMDILISYSKNLYN